MNPIDPSPIVNRPGLAVIAGNDDPDDAARISKLKPQPLSSPMTAPELFPVDAMPGNLVAVVDGVVDKIGAPHAIAAQSALAVSALATQALNDVELPTGQKVAISLYCTTSAESGERKSATDNEMMRGVRRRESMLHEGHDELVEEYERDVEAHKAARADVLKDKTHNGNRSGKRAALERIGPQPQRPLFPFLTVSDPTIEGLIKMLPNAYASLGIMSSEGGALLGGFGFSPDNLLKTAAGFSLLWDAAPLKHVRAGNAEPIVAHGRRLSFGLQIQPGVAASFFGSPVLRDQGLLSRILPVAPESMIGSRSWHDVAPESEQAIDDFARRIDWLLAQRWPLVEGRRNELAPPALRLSPEARRLWIQFADFVEAGMRPDGEFETIRYFANKAPEHAARLAAVMTKVSEDDLSELSGDAMTRGIALVEHYIGEVRRLSETSHIAPEIALAQTVSDWMLNVWPADVVSLPDLYQRGPSRAIRDKASALRIVTILEDHQHLFRLSRPTVVNGTPRRDAWLIVGKGARRGGGE